MVTTNKTCCRKEYFSDKSNSMPTWAIILIVICVVLLCISLLITGISQYNSTSSIGSSDAFSNFLGSLNF